MSFPTIIPMISYEDGIAAIDWLCRAYGFVEQMRMLGDDGRLSHAELRLGEGVIFLASPTPSYQSPRRHGETCAAAAEWQKSRWIIDGALVYVEDLDAHFARAKAAGAEILTEIETGFPGPRYRAMDCEGHRWMFMQR